jgi:hypothetical protein
MDGDGARHLRRRLESHEHWQQAEAVRTGAQPTADPDLNELVEFADGVRRYRDGLSKHLVEGRWVGTLDEEPTALADLNGA